LAGTLDWIQSHETAFWWIAGASTATFIAGLIFVPLLVVRIPCDYFAHGRRRRRLWAERHPAVRLALLSGKNLLGCLFVTTGLILLVLPGQGMLTVLVGLILLDFPGKYQFERWFVARPPVLRSVNWLRRRVGRAPIVLTRPETSP